MQAIYASNVKSDVEYHCNGAACTRLTQRWCAKNSLDGNRELLVHCQYCTNGENPRQYSILSKTMKIPPRRIEMKSRCLFPQECKETEWLNLTNPSQKFQRMKTNPRLSKHSQIQHSYLSFPAGHHRTPMYARRSEPSGCCMLGFLAPLECRGESHQVPPLLIVVLAALLALETRPAHLDECNSV